mgnify:CR=1 FL=1
MANAGRISGTVIQALRWIGPEAIDEQVIAKLKQRLTKAERKQLLADQRQAPAWIATVLRRVAGGSTEGNQ